MKKQNRQSKKVLNSKRQKYVLVNTDTTTPAGGAINNLHDLVLEVTQVTLNTFLWNKQS